MKADSRRSIQPKYNFQIHKDDLNDNIDDIMKNFDNFSQFAIAQQDSVDVEASNDVFEGTKTPTNSETPKDNRSLEFRYYIFCLIQWLI